MTFEFRKAELWGGGASGSVPPYEVKSMKNKIRNKQIIKVGHTDSGEPGPRKTQPEIERSSEHTVSSSVDPRWLAVDILLKCQKLEPHSLLCVESFYFIILIIPNNFTERLLMFVKLIFS